MREAEISPTNFPTELLVLKKITSEEIPNIRSVKHAKNEANRVNFVLQYGFSRFIQFTSSGEGAGMIVTFWPIMADLDKQVQSLQRSFMGKDW